MKTTGSIQLLITICILNILPGSVSPGLLNQVLHARGSRHEMASGPEQPREYPEAAQGVPGTDLPPVLQAYIAQGLSSNRTLRQKQLDYAGSLAALKGARGMFMPDLSLNARYTVADGGRMIEFPVGDLLNPVYSTLNVLTASDLFPQIENETFPFLRPREHETKLSLVQPIFHTDILYNYRIQKEQSEISRISMDQYREELIREIASAYYDHQKASNLLLLADTTHYLVRESLRVSRRLFENQKVTIDEVYRSEAELSRVEARRAEARQMVRTSRAYFNFLLNRPFDSSVELVTEEPQFPQLSLEEAGILALQNRQELKQLEGYRQLNRHVTALHRGKNIPGVTGVVDYGFQGEEYSFTGEDDFVIASIVMQWKIFQGNTNRRNLQQAKIEGDKLRELQAETREKIRLEVINQYYGLQAAYESVRASRKQALSARRAYELISRKYEEGQAPLLELIDARTNMTGASANTIIARSEYFSRLADFRYATGISRPENYQP